MNDKNFIEELRQKREEYGVTQTRLAVACGISREYYNRIEKGKQPLNDELREIIEKQIGRFNPQEPLFLLIDYFRVRFPTTDALAIIRDVLQLKSNYMLYEDYGKYGYESKYVLGDINIMCSMQEHLGVLLELKGKGCRQMECYLLAQERSWYDFMLDCMTAGGVMKRLDLAINDRAGILDIPKLKEKYKAGECMSYFRMQKDYSGTEKCGSDLPKNTGETLYLGSTSSELLLWSSFFVTLVAKKIVLINLCCRPCFIWGSITIITVWTNMIIINVCKFFYLLIECFLCCKLIQICAFILQGIEITLHRCIVVRISCFAHALCHIYRFAEFGKCFGRIL